MALGAAVGRIGATLVAMVQTRLELASVEMEEQSQRWLGHLLMSMLALFLGAIAIVMAVIVMLLAAKSIGDFVDAHPTIKVLALSFLILVGFTLIAEGLDFHVPKGYIYFAMAFSVAVEMINIRMRKRTEKPVRLHKQMRAPGSPVEKPLEE